jgi:hypothetical protein
MHNWARLTDKERGPAMEPTQRRNLPLTTGLAALRFGSRKTVALRAVSTTGSVTATSAATAPALIASFVPFFRRCLLFFGGH